MTYLYGTVLTYSSGRAYYPYDAVWIGRRHRGTRTEGIGHEAPERRTRILSLADPRDRAGFHAGGCLGSSRVRRRRGLPGAAHDHDVRQPGPRGVPGDSPAVRGPLAPRPVVRLGWWRRTADSGPGRSVAGRTAAGCPAPHGRRPEARFPVPAPVSHRHPGPPGTSRPGP